MALPGRGRLSATSFRPFLQHITKSTEQRRRRIKLSNSPPRPRVLTTAEAQTILDGCDHLRDRLLFALLLDTGLRIGEALGLRHEDVDIAGRQVLVIARANDNRARAKGGRHRFIPASGELMRLYADYLNREYQALDSDYVFVNLWGRPPDHPVELSGGLRPGLGGSDVAPASTSPRTGSGTPTRPGCCVGGRGLESVKELLGPASITTTVDTYGHLSVEDAARRWRPRVGSPEPRSVGEPGEHVCRILRILLTWPGREVAGCGPIRVPCRRLRSRPRSSGAGAWRLLVDGCDRSRTGNRLCSSHQKRWIDRGRPELADFLTDPGPTLNGRRELTGCAVPGCRY